MAVSWTLMSCQRCRCFCKGPVGSLGVSEGCSTFFPMFSQLGFGLGIQCCFFVASFFFFCVVVCCCVVVVFGLVCLLVFSLVSWLFRRFTWGFEGCSFVYSCREEAQHGLASDDQHKFDRLLLYFWTLALSPFGKEKEGFTTQPSKGGKLWTAKQSCALFVAVRVCLLEISSPLAHHP